MTRSVERSRKTCPKNPSVQSETLSLGVHHIAILHALRLGHESSLVQVGVKLLRLALHLLAGVEPLQTVLLEGVHEDVLGHVETGNEVKQVLVGLGLDGIKLVRGHGQQRAVEVVNALEEVLGEALDGEVAGAVHVTLGAFLQIAELGDGAEVFVLLRFSVVQQLQ